MLTHLKKIVGRIDFLLLSFIIGIFLINTPYLNLSFLPHHDTMFNFQIFYFFYNEYFFHHTIAQWMPYGAHGIPAGVFQICILTPAQYLIGFWGALLGVKDVLFLFNISVVLEQLIFLLGIYLLARFFFVKKTVISLVCIAAFCSMEWGYQLYWNLRFYELFPFVLYFLVLFFERKRAMYFWTAGIISIFWSLGTCFYFSILWFFIFCVIGAVLFAYHPQAWRDIRPRFKIDAVVMMFFIFFAAVYLLYFKFSFDHIAIINRESGGANSLDTFRVHGGFALFNTVISWFLMGTPLHTSMGQGRDNTAYVGFVTIIFFFWAIGFVRNKYFLALLAGFVALVWLSLGGIITALVYYFPMMKFYRHVGLVYPLVKVFVTLGAGFGLADFLNCPGKVRLKRLVLTLGACLLLVDLPLNPDFFQDEFAFLFIGELDSYRASTMKYLYLTAFVSCAALYIIGIIRNKIKKRFVLPKFNENILAVLLIVVLCLDMAIFQQALYKDTPQLPKDGFVRSIALKSVKVNQLQFVKQRGADPVGRQTSAFTLQSETADSHSIQYESIYAFAQDDPCQATPGSGMLTVYVKKFFDAKILDSNTVNRISGCHAPKLRLLGQEDYMPSAPHFDEALPEAGNIVVNNFSADKLSLTVDVNKNGGAWLFYADSFYPGWHAYIDGISSKVHEAYIAYKSVFVPDGKHRVEFVYFNAITTLLSYIIAILCLLVGLGVFIFLLITLLFSFDLTAYL